MAKKPDLIPPDVLNRLMGDCPKVESITYSTDDDNINVQAEAEEAMRLYEKGAGIA